MRDPVGPLIPLNGCKGTKNFAIRQIITQFFSESAVFCTPQAIAAVV